MEYCIYIMISKTHTKFARALRTVGRIKYNHASVSLDAELNELYSFARPQHNALLLAGLVKESVFRYSLGKASRVNVEIFKIPVTKEQHEKIKQIIELVQGDKEYIYNLIAVISYPLLKGFHMHKAFSCIEFVMYILHKIGFKLEKPLYKYKPDDLTSILNDYQYFEGNLLEYITDYQDDLSYYAPFTYEIAKRSTWVSKEYFRRIIFK